MFGPPDVGVFCFISIEMSSKLREVHDPRCSKLSRSLKTLKSCDVFKMSLYNCDQRGEGWLARRWKTELLRVGFPTIYGYTGRRWATTVVAAATTDDDNNLHICLQCTIVCSLRKAWTDYSFLWNMDAILITMSNWQMKTWETRTLAWIPTLFISAVSETFIE